MDRVDRVGRVGGGSCSSLYAVKNTVFKHLNQTMVQPFTHYKS